MQFCSVGSKEAIHNTFLAFLEAGYYKLIADPGYPVYQTSTIFAGGEFFTMPLKAENNFLPDLSAIPSDVVSSSLLVMLTVQEEKAFPTSVASSNSTPEKGWHSLY